MVENFFKNFWKTPSHITCHMLIYRRKDKGEKKMKKTDKKVRITQIIARQVTDSVEKEIWIDEEGTEYVKDSNGYFCKVKDVRSFYKVQKM